MDGSLDPKAYNKAVLGEARKTLQMLHTGIQGFNKGSGELKKGLRWRSGKYFDLVNRVSYYFPRHGVFVEKGAGRGYPVRGRAESDSAIGRKPKPWYNPVLKKQVPAMADVASQHLGDAVMYDLAKSLIK